MKRVAAAIISLLMGVALISMIATPANAITASDCTYHDRGVLNTDAAVCVSLEWQRQSDGSGLTLESVTISCIGSGMFEDDMQVDGYFLEIYNTNTGNGIWYKDGANSNITNNCYRRYDISSSVNNVPTNSVTVHYSYKARLDNWPDPTGNVDARATR